MARFTLATSLLQQGKWIEGFSQYRVRFSLPGVDPDLFLDEVAHLATFPPGTGE